LLTAHLATLKLRLHNLYLSGPELEGLIHLITKATYRILEQPSSLKDAKITAKAYNIVSMCVTRYHHGLGARTTMIQNLQYYEYMSEPMANLLYQITQAQAESPTLSDEVLRHVAGVDFPAQSSSTLPRSFGRFLTHYASLAPKTLSRQMVHIIRLLDVEHYQMRCAMVQVIGHVLDALLREDQDSRGGEVRIKAVEGYFDLLEDRFRDTSAYVRSKTLQVLYRLSDSKAKFPRRRGRLVELTSGRLEDISSQVRVQAIRLLTQWIRTHPFLMDGGPIGLQDLEEELQRYVQGSVQATVDAEMNECTQVTDEHKDEEHETNEEDEMEDKEVTEGDDDDDGDQFALIGSSPPVQAVRPSEPLGEALLQQAKMVGTDKRFQILQVQLRYYQDALAFVEQMEEAIPLLTQLLGSTHRAEVVDAMEFFVVAHRYGLEASEEGIRKMVHLVWSKDGGASATAPTSTTQPMDEDGLLGGTAGTGGGRSIRSRLIEAYKEIYFTPSPPRTLRDKLGVQEVVSRLIRLAGSSGLTELTSLEQLLMELVQSRGPKEKKSEEDNGKEEGERDQARRNRRAAVLLLRMLGKADRRVVGENVDLILRVGLGEAGRQDYILARYSCEALSTLGADPNANGKGILGTKDKSKGRKNDELEKGTDEETRDQSPLLWFSLAEAVLNTVYRISQRPDAWSERLLKHLTNRVFLSEDENEEETISQGDKSKGDMDGDKSVFLSQTPSNSGGSGIAQSANALALSQWIFLAGHVALRQIVYMEEVEGELKRRQSGGSASGGGGAEEDELDQVGGGGGGGEDEVVMEAMHLLRERHLLYGEDALLAPFAGILPYIASSRAELHPILLLSATLSLGKIMCVSATYCEKHLPLLLTLMQRTTSLPSLRGNLVIILGDLTVSFASLLEPHVASLYGRLKDKDSRVRRAALLVLTHLILHGMIKVKGHLGDLAGSLEDTDTRNVDLARLFFSQLAAKDPLSLLSHLPDLISHLSSSPHGALPDEASFARVMRFLLPLAISATGGGGAGKGTGGESRVAQEGVRQWRDAALCISLLPIRTEKTFRHLQDALPLYRHTLHDPVVLGHFRDVLGRARLGK
ncbi:armadillo-type protein, partial [Piptocephalis cylindrospora]